MGVPKCLNVQVGDGEAAMWLRPGTALISPEEPVELETGRRTRGLLAPALTPTIIE